MYTHEQLLQYPFFAEKISENGINNILDPLTGAVARKHIIGYAYHLIEKGIPFTYAIMDLDNFKFVNDNLGHHIGDEVLFHVASDLIRYTEGYAVVGRFGGDELLIVNTRDIAYDEKKAFCSGMYAYTVLRKNIELEGCSPFITATVGCASFPENAQNYDDLFAMVDKTLYRGKTKGRNCYIIYVKEKHEHIEIRKLAKSGMYTTFHSMVRQFEFVPGIRNKLRSVLPLLMDEMRISDLYYTGSRGILHSVRNPELRADVHDIGNLVISASDEMFSDNSLERVQKISPVFCQVMQDMEIETLLVVQIRIEMEQYGYLLCAEQRNRRIWQEDECAILYFLARMLAASIRLDGEKIDD